MIMGNYLSVSPVPLHMATEPTAGMDHLTVVPENFEPQSELDPDADAADRPAGERSR